MKRAECVISESEPSSLPLPSNLRHWSFQGAKLRSFPPIWRIEQFESLDFSNNPITSFRELASHPNLCELDVSNTLIASFERAQPQPSLTRISLANSPLGKQAMADVMCVIAFGANIQFLNGVGIENWRHKMGCVLRDFLRPFLQEGWVLLGLNPIRCAHVRTKVKKVFNLKGLVSLPSGDPPEPPARTVKSPRKRAPPGDNPSNEKTDAAAPKSRMPLITPRVSRGGNNAAFPTPALPRDENAMPKKAGPANITLHFIELAAAELTDSESTGSVFADSSDSSTPDLLRMTPRGVSRIQITAPAEAEVEKMEYHEITFDEAVRALTPSFQPIVRFEDSLGTNSSSLHQNSNRNRALFNETGGVMKSNKHSSLAPRQSLRRTGKPRQSSGWPWFVQASHPPSHTLSEVEAW
jgi:Leucine-rich repeat (LRR) protein